CPNLMSHPTQKQKKGIISLSDRLRHSLRLGLRERRRGRHLKLKKANLVRYVQSWSDPGTKHTPRGLRRDMIDNHFLDVILQCCSVTQSRIKGLEKVTKSGIASPKRCTGEPIRPPSQTRECVPKHAFTGEQSRPPNIKLHGYKQRR